MTTKRILVAGQEYTVSNALVAVIETLLENYPDVVAVQSLPDAGDVAEHIRTDKATDLGQRLDIHMESADDIVMNVVGVGELRFRVGVGDGAEVCIFEVERTGYDTRAPAFVNDAFAEMDWDVQSIFNQCFPLQSQANKKQAKAVLDRWEAEAKAFHAEINEYIREVWCIEEVTPEFVTLVQDVYHNFFMSNN